MIQADLPDPIPLTGRCSSSPVDWTEDWEYENGNYQCSCVRCGTAFIGHKRRVTCRMCASKSFLEFDSVDERIACRELYLAANQILATTDILGISPSRNEMERLRKAVAVIAALREHK